MNKKITTFTDLNNWQEGHKLILQTYQITRDFPKEEAYGSTSQIRRTGISSTSNITEGFGKKSYKEKLQFFFNTHRSLIEVKSQLIFAKNLTYISDSVFDKVINQTNIAHQLPQGLIQTTKKKSH